jgi:hypothetical protein
VSIPVIAQLDFLLSFLLFPFLVMHTKTFSLVRVGVAHLLPNNKQGVPKRQSIRQSLALLPSHNACRFPFFIRFS